MPPRRPDAAARADARELRAAGFGLLVLPLGIIDATYGVAMLRAIARRAETIDAADILAAPNDSGATIVP